MRREPAVEHADVDLALVERGAAIDDVAAGDVVVLAMHFGVVLPQLLAGARVDRVGDAPRSGRIHHAVDDERRGFEAAVGRGLELPREAELGDVLVVDLIERAEALLVIVAAVRQPVLVARLERSQRRVVHRRLLLGGSPRNAGDDGDGDTSGKRTDHGMLLGGFYGNSARWRAGACATVTYGQGAIRVFRQVEKISASFS